MKANINGIKCDNPKCDWNDMTFEWVDIEATIKNG